jgi:hypothetical protein
MSQHLTGYRFGGVKLPPFFCLDQTNWWAASCSYDILVVGLQAQSKKKAAPVATSPTMRKVVMTVDQSEAGLVSSTSSVIVGS